MALLLSLLGLIALGYIAWLTVDGLAAIVRRWRAEKARQPLWLTVQQRTEVAGELLCLQLAHPKRKRLPAFAAGQHLLLTAPAGREGKTIQRAYSLAAWTPKPRHYELGIKREAQGAMTQWLWQHLQPGMLLQVSPPQGHFTVAPDSGLLVLIGGGIGITPMRAMLHAALRENRPILLLHSARSEDALLYREEFTALAAAHPQFHYHPQLSQPNADWAGARGRLDAAQVLAAIDALAPRATADCYLCASQAMMEDLCSGLSAAGLGDHQLHWEAFGAAASAGQSGHSLAIRQGKTTRVCTTAGEPSLLATLEANAIALPAECRAGSCGQCACRLLAGSVEWLAQTEFALSGDTILPCICAAQSDLTLQIS